MKKDDKPTPVGKGSEGKPILEASPKLTRAITGKPNFATKRLITASKEEDGNSVQLASPRESRQEGRRTVVTAQQ